MAFGSKARRAARRAPIVPFEAVQWKASPKAPSEIPHVVPAPPPLATVNLDSSDVPSGTARELLTWVGEDKDRAQRALERELDADNPRTTLVDTLYRII